MRASSEQGFLTGWAKLIRFDVEYPPSDRVPTVDATSAEIDTTLKILEILPLAGRSKLLDESTLAQMRELRKALSGAADLASNKYRDWQAEYAE